MSRPRNQQLYEALLNQQKPAGQVTQHYIRPYYPLHSQQMQDILEEIEADANKIINRILNHETFLKETAASLAAINRNLTEAQLQRGQVQNTSEVEDHTTNWRLL